MEYSIVENKLLINKRLLKNQNFINLFCLSVFNLFSYEIDMPRVLVNFNKLDNLINSLKTNADVICLDSLVYSKFCLAVHECEFDLGIFLVNKNNFIEFNFISGSGQKLSLTKMSIIENFFKNFEKNSKNNKKNSKKLLKIEKINVKYAKSNKCTAMQKNVQNDKLKNFLHI